MSGVLLREWAEGGLPGRRVRESAGTAGEVSLRTSAVHGILATVRERREPRRSEMKRKRVGIVIFPDVEVLDFRSQETGPLQESDDASVTIAVEAGTAARIASALETGTVTLVRATGAAPLETVVAQP